MKEKQNEQPLERHLVLWPEPEDWVNEHFALFLAGTVTILGLIIMVVTVIWHG